MNTRCNGKIYESGILWISLNVVTGDCEKKAWPCIVHLEMLIHVLLVIQDHC